MIEGLDSAYPPSPAAVLAAKAAGVDLWSGYISSAPYDGNSHFGLYHPWPRAGFETARLCGATPIAFCSGWDAPGTLKALAAAWNVRLCLDIEGGIRPDGPWKQAWLDASGAGVYGNIGCHNCRAAFHVLAAYPGSGDVRATWAGPRPATPCGWQWAGTHPEFGVTVDRGDYDDYFLGGEMTLAELLADPNWQALVWRVAILAGDLPASSAPPAIKPFVHGAVTLPQIMAELTALKAQVAGIQGGGALTDAQAGELQGILQILTAHFQPVKPAQP